MNRRGKSTVELERFYRKAVITESGCILWEGKRDKQGYGRLYANGDSSYLVHRFAYETFVGPIPAGLQIHHTCENRACVNPGHLEALTPAEHTARHYATHCIAGHPFDEANTRTIKGKRHCRRCDARRQRDYRNQRVAA